MCFFILMKIWNISAAFFFGLRPKKTQGEKTQEIQKLKEKNSNSSLKINFSAKSDKNVNKLT